MMLFISKFIRDFKEYKKLYERTIGDSYILLLKHIKIEIRLCESIHIQSQAWMAAQRENPHKITKRDWIYEYTISDIEDDKNIITEGYLIREDPFDVSRFGSDLEKKYRPYDEYIEEYLLCKSFF